MQNLILDGLPPYPPQQKFFESRARHTAYGGARGGGKSWAMRRKFVLLALSYPKLRILLLRRTFPELESNHIKPLLSELNNIATYTDKRKEFLFPNGSIIKCGYCDTENDVYQYLGQEYEVIGLEEATQFTESQMLFLATCNRTTRTDFKPRMYYTCNPGGPGHQWVKRLFIDRDYQNGEDPDDYVFIPAKVYDNKALMEADPGYIKSLQNLPEDLRRAHLEGDWDGLMGQYFKEWRRDKHVISPIKLSDDWKRFRMMDWGYNDPCCVLWGAIAPDSRIYIYRELYLRQTLAHDMALLVKDRTGKERISYTVASPDMWNKRGTGMRQDGGMAGENIADIFLRGGIPLRPADNSRVVGWQRVREYLRDAPDEVPYLQVFDSCENLIRQMPMLQYDQNDHEDAADGNDHAPEALRYGIMSRPRPTFEKSTIIEKIKRFDPLNLSNHKEQSGFLGM